MHAKLIKTERFINAEAGIIEHEGKQGPAIVLSFGDEESSEQYAEEWVFHSDHYFNPERNK